LEWDFTHLIPQTANKYEPPTNLNRESEYLRNTYFENKVKFSGNFNKKHYLKVQTHKLNNEKA
jgi:hypothetical protein